jgi:hypothetical protein
VKRKSTDHGLQSTVDWCMVNDLLKEKNAKHVRRARDKNRISHLSRVVKKSKSIPFEFVLEQLAPLDVQVKPMFGCHALYVREKIVLILRKKENAEKDNGVWVATTPDHHKSLRKEFPSMREIGVFGDKSSWQNIPSDSDDFEESVMKACGLILRNDPRIGKVPRPKKRNK